MKNINLFFDWAQPLTNDLDSACDSVLITALSMHPPRDNSTGPISRLWAALQAAAARGIRIDVILAGASKAHPATAMNNATAARLHAIGAHHHAAPPARLLHAKTAVVDNSIVWVGSGNWTAAASAHNHEAYIRTIHADMARAMRAHWQAVGLIGG